MNLDQFIRISLFSVTQVYHLTTKLQEKSDGNVRTAIIRTIRKYFFHNESEVSTINIIESYSSYY